jgi:MoaA/NifB/PqqE/SkfB family radical SAM enzyme
LSELSGGALWRINLLGGEPLLNPAVADYVRIARRYFQNTPIFIFTNGLRLLQPAMEEFWLACKDCCAVIGITLYPVKIDMEAIRHKAFRFGVELECFASMGKRDYTGRKYSVRFKLNRERVSRRPVFVDCYQMNYCNVLKNGKIYACPISAHVNYFNDYFDEHFLVSEKDYIDLYKIHSFAEIAEFASRPVPFCGYCDIKGRELYPWKQSDKTLGEYI